MRASGVVIRPGRSARTISMDGLPSSLGVSSPVTQFRKNSRHDGRKANLVRVADDTRMIAIPNQIAPIVRDVGKARHARMHRRASTCRRPDSPKREHAATVAAYASGVQGGAWIADTRIIAMDSRKVLAKVEAVFQRGAADPGEAKARDQIAGGKVHGVAINVIRVALA